MASLDRNCMNVWQQKSLSSPWSYTFEPRSQYFDQGHSSHLLGSHCNNHVVVYEVLNCSSGKQPQRFQKWSLWCHRCHILYRIDGVQAHINCPGSLQCYTWRRLNGLKQHTQPGLVLLEDRLCYEIQCHEQWIRYLWLLRSQNIYVQKFSTTLTSVASIIGQMNLSWLYWIIVFLFS